MKEHVEKGAARRRGPTAPGADGGQHVVHRGGFGVGPVTPGGLLIAQCYDAGELLGPARYCAQLAVVTSWPTTRPLWCGPAGDRRSS